jgi:hypothetical protein
MTRTLPLIVAAAVLLVSGILHGVWTDRWKAAEEPARFADRLAQVPRVIGDWESGESQELDAKRVEMAQLSGYLLRNYENRRDRSHVSLLIVAGRSGPVATHPPDICYVGSGFALAAPPTRFPLQTAAPGQPSEFWAAKFRKGDDAAPSQLRILWAWSGGGPWQAPDTPRLVFARYPALYKLYLVRPLTNADEPLDRDPCLDFLRTLLPELQRSLFPDARP